MEKLIVDQTVAKGLVHECLDAPVAWTLALISRLKKKPIHDLVVFMLERPRHQKLIEEVRTAGARVWLRADGDVSGAILAAMPESSVDLLLGIGGVAEGTLAACAVNALGGGMLGRLAPQSREEREKVESADLDVHHIYSAREILKDEEVYIAATGITNGLLLKGIEFKGERAESNSLILRGETGTRRIIMAEHLIDKHKIAR
jgi:fructose-1,6-bisphosphatase II